jgi:conjugal transfer/type IV secretion protein DotA/TraY
MRSIVASISEFFLSILSQHRLVPVRAHARVTVSVRRTRRPLSKLFSLLLPFVFALTLFAAAPNDAQAATGASGAGTFDCLGDYDWGCRAVSFLFDDKDNTLTYYRDNAPIVDKAGPIEEGMRAMMAFFSNAMLIVAGLMLLYHLIVMVAETAHTGTIGGKETNQLWAPIRLVVAIGLLVPLASGLNSGQYIVMQVAKWGSGLASQTWKVFAAKLGENSSLKAPIMPRVYNLSLNTLKTYVCVGIINNSIAPDLQREAINPNPTAEDLGDRKKEKFGNKVYSDVCGTIVYHVPDTKYDKSHEAEIATNLTAINEAQYKSASQEMKGLAVEIAKDVLTKDRPASSRDRLEDIVQRYYDNLGNALKETGGGYANNALKQITDKIKTAADTQGWTSAGAWFMAVGRAQGQIITGGLNVPEATGPREDILKDKYPEQYKAYDLFLRSIIDGTSTKSVASVNMNGDVPSAKQEAAEWSSLQYATSGEGVIDMVMGFLDWIAQRVGLWTGDPKRAFGDLGYSTNPFGEIAALGYTKIRLAFDYMGIAVAASLPAGYLKNFNGIPTLLGDALMWISAICMFFAMLFMLAGVLLGFIVPTIPFIRFAFAIMTWLGTFLEAMICMPFFALAFLTPKGEGFTGPNARQGMFLIFQIFLRPVLCIFGLIASMMLFYIMAKFLNAMFFEATSGIGIFTGGAMVFMQKFVFSILYAGMIYITANMSFKMMEHIPKHAMRWMGGSAGEEGYEGHSEFLGLAGALSGQQIMGQVNRVSSGAQMVGSGLGNFKGGMDMAELYQSETDNVQRMKRGANGQPMRKQQRDAAGNGITDAGGQPVWERDANGAFVYEMEKVNMPVTAGQERVARLQAMKEMQANEQQTQFIKDQGEVIAYHISRGTGGRTGGGGAGGGTGGGTP